MSVGIPANFGRSNPLRPENKARQLSLSIHEYRNSKGEGGRPLLSLNQSKFYGQDARNIVGRQKDSVSISIKINTNNDNQYLISKYGFFMFCLMFPEILKLAYLQNFIFTKCKALTLTEFLCCYRDCCLVSTRDSYILKPTADKAFRKNTSRFLAANFFRKKHHKLLVT